jgi:hypothetical protein
MALWQAMLPPEADNGRDERAMLALAGALEVGDGGSDGVVDGLCLGTVGGGGWWGGWGGGGILVFLVGLRGGPVTNNARPFLRKNGKNNPPSLLHAYSSTPLPP